MPLLRYRTGDLVTVETGACPCGDRRRVLHHHGRVEDRYRVGEVGVMRIDLEEVILSTPGSGPYYVAAAANGGLRVWVECGGGAAEDCCRQIAGRIRERFAVPATVDTVSRAVIAPALDRMLKPGSLQLEHVQSLLEGHDGATGAA
jgi:phenylacetate-CoA ligase